MDRDLLYVFKWFFGIWERERNLILDGAWIVF
jgi:hypothetical protein